MATALRERKSDFVKLFDKTPAGVICPHFYELVLSNGCPYDCAYCYLRLTFRGHKSPVLFTNSWDRVRAEIEAIDQGVFSTGELADSLAVEPPLLQASIDYFTRQERKYLLLVTKSTNTRLLRRIRPSPQIIVSFSVNSMGAAQEYEAYCPDPAERLREAEEMLSLGWRVRIRLDPIILQCDLAGYEDICSIIREIKPEIVTIGTLRQYPGLHRFAKTAPRNGLSRAPDGRMRYEARTRICTYEQIAGWLGFQPALCKETTAVWEALGWTFSGCNCSL